MTNQKYKQTNENVKPLTYWEGVDFSNPDADKIFTSSTTREQPYQELFDYLAN